MAWKQVYIPCRNGVLNTHFAPWEIPAPWVFDSPGQDCQNWEFLHAEQSSNHAKSVCWAKSAAMLACLASWLSFFPLHRSFLMSIYFWNVQTEFKQPRKRSMDLPHRRRQMQVKKAGAFRRLVCMWLYDRIWSENTGCFKGQGISSDLALCLFVTGSQVGPSIPLKPSFTEAWLQLPFLQRFRCSSRSLGRTTFGHCMDAKHCSNSQCYSSSMAWAPRTDGFGHHKNCNFVQSATTGNPHRMTRSLI